MLVIMPLITGGALHNVLRSFGIRLPSAMFGGTGHGRGRYDNVYSSYGDRRASTSFDSLGGGALQSVLKMAQMLM